MAVPRVTARGIKQGADVVLVDGSVRELKDYALTSQYYTSNAQGVAADLARQAELRIQEGYRDIRFVFPGDVGAMPLALDAALRVELARVANAAGLPATSVTFEIWTP